MLNKPQTKITQPLLSVAPMMQWTDRHCRYFHRILSKNAILYTEMVTASAIIHGPRARLLSYDHKEHPVVLQMGGSDPSDLARATAIASSWDYDEINLNVGCPSDRVQSGAFGAVLMRDPVLVAKCVQAMQAESTKPITVKCRIGVDEQEPQSVLPRFIETLANAGVQHVIIHARKAWLQGLSPKENRDIPPLDHQLVVAMKKVFPELTITLNGGVSSFESIKTILNQNVDGVMVGRAAYHTPAEILLHADSLWGDTPPCADLFEAAGAMRPYIAAHLEAGGRLHHVTRHMLGLFSGYAGAKLWRQRLSSSEAHLAQAGLDLYDAAIADVHAAQNNGKDIHANIR